ncbi:MAG: phosphoribosylformylglycinamidine synthase subunit PurL [Candidatus Omnitrophica bacterium]|nr:phosphoribosylformylglycinamidine synthase subunit PurL [Candidatus Omnitrophota bacterium]
MIKPHIYKSLGLATPQYKKILEILKREPTPTELAIFSVEWSEHCGYCSSKKLLKLLPKKGKAKTLIGEDAGGVVIDKNLAIVFKMESHNHPSQVEPHQGAATGVGGIIRDIFTCGARPIALLDSLRFGPINKAYNRYIFKGVVDGIQFYGNCVGVPTVGGEIYFEKCYSGNCLVNVMCIGVVDPEKVVRAKAEGVGNSLIYAGASTGRDGIGGCSVLASCEFKEKDEKRPTVQIGDPFMEKCLIEATLEALETGDIVGIKDMGAAGLTCSISEMVATGDVGAQIELERVPLRQKNLEPWEIMMSESQERMLMCVKEGKEKKIKKIFQKWGLNAEVIGKITNTKFIDIKYKNQTVAKIPAKSLVNAPLYNRKAEKPKYLKILRSLNLKKISKIKNYNKILLTLLGSENICSKKWVYEQYDHMVQTNTVILPGSDAAVLKLKGTNKAIAATTDCNSRYCFVNPYRGAQIAVAEAARNLVCSGAEPLAVTDCLNFGNPNNPTVFWEFKNCIKGIASACKYFNLAVVSGNVSFYNESPKGRVYPTPIIGMIGVIYDVGKATSHYFKKEDDVIILLGVCKNELGASEYLSKIYKVFSGDAPSLDLALEKAVQKTTLESISRSLVSSAHDCSEGGLAVALAECCIFDKENMIGAIIYGLDFNIREDALLFGETQSRIIISCPKNSVEHIRKIAQKNNAPFKVIGKTGGKNLIIYKKNKVLLDVSLEKLHNRWYNSLEEKII